MTQPAAFAMTLGIVAADLALVLTCCFVKREPFITLDRWLAAAWAVIYRWTGAAALDRRINRRKARQDAALFADLAGRLDAAGLATAAARCRDAAARSQAQIQG